MSDLPERIWVDGVGHVWKYDPAPAIGYKEYLRADLTTAPVGYSREQMVTAMQWADVTDHYIKEDRDEYLSDLTPATKVPIHGPVFVAINDIIQRAGDAIFELDRERTFDDLRREMDNWVSEVTFLTKGRGGI
jgi:hypothetical protein